MIIDPKLWNAIPQEVKFITLDEGDFTDFFSEKPTFWGSFAGWGIETVNLDRPKTNLAPIIKIAKHLIKLETWQAIAERPPFKRKIEEDDVVAVKGFDGLYVVEETDIKTPGLKELLMKVLSDKGQPHFTLPSEIVSVNGIRYGQPSGLIPESRNEDKVEPERAMEILRDMCR
ncbi:hypothetical protein [Candidatus Sororendozoicomonas aggregata]|uniref:hypothetical protein n=1 Tax=Candidatus Sororendozoicomonas aggregata TaxID=3073239 RepID=UPI002ED6BA46